MAFASLCRSSCHKYLELRPLAACEHRIVGVTNHACTFHTSCLTHAQRQDDDDGNRMDRAPGAMSRRLSDLTETNLENAGSAARQTIEHSGFDEKLKQRLLDRLEDAEFRSRNAGPIAHANMPSSAGAGSKHHASARPWDGYETLEDSTLRMLTDAFKPLRTPAKIPNPIKPPKKVNTGRPRKQPNTGVRLANARDRSSLYSYSKDDAMKKEEREEQRRILKERFQPAARPLPGTLQGLAALANERIEDAIARGQFKNLPRGKAVVRDSTADSPFLDTTEYFMNKIIKKQDIVPPWIEKQQELVSTATRFRNRLRADWKRHAARVIASKGGPLERQIECAEMYAAAEAQLNPVKQVEKLDAVSINGHMSQITLTGQLRPPTDNPETIQPIQELSIREDHMRENDPAADPTPSLHDSKSTSASDETPEPPRPTTIEALNAVGVFRDAHWETTERPYLTAAIEDLNSKARSYNLIAPSSAKKPYYSLDRELAACFADCAPQVANEIRERAKAPKVQVEIVGGHSDGILGTIGGNSAKVYDERRPRYGLREFFRDLLSPPS